MSNVQMPAPRLIGRRQARLSTRDRKRAVRRRGFTLMEVLIAIALLLALFGAMFGFLLDILATRQHVLELTTKHRAASLLIDRVEADLLVCIVGDERHGSGVVGDSTSLRLLTRSSLAGAEGDAAFSDLQQTEYRFDPISHQLSGSRTQPQQTADSHQIANRIYKVRFRYHDGDAWQDRFDSAELGRLPLAIEVAVWFEPWPGEDWSELDDRFTSNGAEAAERLTFDMGDTFDESEWAMRADRDLRDDPLPDRIRVIAVPDAEEEGNV